jgi:magnesium transporter
MTVRAVVAGTEGIQHYDDLVAAREAYGTTWVSLTEPTEDELAVTTDAFGLHPLSIEDVGNAVRPKTEAFRGHTFVLVKTATLVPEDTTFDEEIDEQPVALFLGDDWLVTLSYAEIPAIEPAWSAATADEGKLLGRGPDFAAYRVLDGVVDGYFTLLDDIETEIEYVEEELLETTDIATLEAINSVRRELLLLRKLLWPSRDAVGTLARGTPDEVRQPNEKYFRDVYDHLVQLVDLTETYRDLTASARDIYLNTLSSPPTR